jgi:dihydroflavonol-4-reductase
MRVLIAGATGFIGQRLTTAALDKGWDVHFLVRNPGDTVSNHLQSLGAKLIRGDLTQPQTIQDAFSRLRPSHYFHNAGWYELGIAARHRENMWKINVQGLANVLDVAEENNVEKVVITSSTTALGDTGGEVVDEHFKRQSEPNSWYEHTMHEAHRIIRSRVEEGRPIVVGSPAQVIGPGDHSVFGIMLRLFLRRLLPLTLWAPEGAFSFVHVDDVANGLVRVMEDGEIGDNYFFAGSIMTNREMIEFWKSHTGRSFPVIWLPRSLAMVVGHLAAPLLRLTGQPAFISPEVVRSSFVSFRYSDQKARSELGLSLRSAKEGWSDTIEVESR